MRRPDRASVLGLLAALLAGCQGAPSGASLVMTGVAAGVATGQVPAPAIAAAGGVDPFALPEKPAFGGGAERHAPDELVVTLAPGATGKDLLAKPAAAGAAIARDLAFSDGHLVTLRVDPARLDATYAALARVDVVTHVAYNTFAEPHSVPNDPKYGEQWPHKPAFANTEGAWDLMSGIDQSKVIVAVIDSGVDPDHEEFQGPAGERGGRLIAARNVTPRRPGDDVTEERWAETLTDDLGHGTLTAGIIGANANNGKGGAGVAWGVRIMPIKADSYDDEGNTTFRLADVVAAIKYAVDYRDADVPARRVRVINMSLGANIGRVNPIYYDAVAYARKKGVLVVASVGNLGAPVIASPANTPGVIAVGSTSNHLGAEFVSHFSNYGDRLDLVAPGGGIFCPIPTHPSQVGSRAIPPVMSYAYAEGTSEAAPYVAGVAALVFAKYDPANASTADDLEAQAMAEKVRVHLQRAVDDLGPPGWDPSAGYGRLNAYKALKEAQLMGRDPTETHQTID